MVKPWSLAWVCLVTLTVAKQPSKAESTREGLTILAYNDLDNTPPPGSGAILIHYAQDYLAAVDACKQISETLWEGEGPTSHSTLKSSLAHQVYQGNHAPGVKFWVAKRKGSCKCPAIGTDGSIHHLKCTESLPILCSQSAPVSNATSADTSSRFQITQEVGDSHITGYRDFFSWKFLGIRYAPTPQRFEYSTTLRNASGPISALKPGTDCFQPNVSDSGDDCLFLNIWTPFLPSSSGVATSSKPALKPVLFYIYGGAFVTGSSKNPNLDLTNFASRGDVVAVSMNHRAGNFAMLVLNDGIHTGNIAINDQISALKWVVENIAAFGGDPNRITLAGESSGAMSVRLLLTSPEAEGLYAGALMQSDGNGGLLQPEGIFWTPEESYNYFTKTVLKAVGCDNTEDEVVCLREIPGENLANLDLDTATAKFPVLDGKYLVTPFFPLDGSGPLYAKDIPLLTGVTRDEAALLSYIQDIDWSRLDVEAILGNLPLFGISAQSTSYQLLNATVDILSHYMYTCLDRAKAFSGAKNDVFEKVYSFNFYRTYSPPPYYTPLCKAPATSAHPFGDPTVPYYRCHGGSQVTMFGNYERVGLPDRDGLDQDFSRLIVDYFASFVRTGDPNPDYGYLVARGYGSTLAQVKKVGEWEKVDPASPEWMILEWDGFMTPFGDEEVCSTLGQPLDYWENMTVSH